MSRTEHQLRRPQSPAAYLVAQLRAGHVTQAAVRLRAYLGDEAARSVLGWCDCAVTPKGTHPWEFHDDGQPPEDWITGLLPLMEPLDPWPFKVACTDGWHGLKTPTSTYCISCDVGSGTRLIKIPVRRYLSVVGCLAVGRARHAQDRCGYCWTCNGHRRLDCNRCAGTGTRYRGTNRKKCGRCAGKGWNTCRECEGSRCRICVAFDRCAVWLATPSEANARALHGPALNESLPLWAGALCSLVYMSTDHNPRDVDSDLQIALTSATQILPSSRQVFAEAVLAELKKESG